MSGTPLPGGEAEAAEAESAESEEAPPTETSPARPPVPQFKWSTFLLTFLFILGLWMVIDSAFRNGVAGALGTPSSPGGLYSLIGFHSQYLLLTMLLAGAIEMIITSLAYNWTTDWIKAARAQAWGAAFRKVQMAALRSGKKDKIEALRESQQKLTRLTSEVSIAQLKGLAITWFLLIMIYTWVGILIGTAPVAAQTVSLGGAALKLTAAAIGPIQWWFLIFSVYTVPLSLVFRRILKHYSLRKYAARASPAALTDVGAAGGAA